MLINNVFVKEVQIEFYTSFTSVYTHCILPILFFFIPVQTGYENRASNISLFSIFNGKKENNRKCKTHWYLVLLCLVSSKLSLHYNTSFWLKARRNERREMFL